jgi:hypothetical protein
MAFDALGILKGHYSGALVEVDESDAVATSLTANSDGNVVVDLKKSGAKGLSAVLIWTAISSTAPYSDEGTIIIEASDELDRNWEQVAEFPTMHCYLRRLKDCIATTGFVALDATTPRVLTATTEGSTGLIVSFDEALKTIGGVGDIVVEMQDSADVYATAGVVITATSGTGVGTQGLAGVAEVPQMVPGIHVCRFSTNKRYVRCNCETVADGLGTAWILLTNHAFETI